MIKQIAKAYNTGCVEIFGYYINYGKLKVNNEKTINIVYPQMYQDIPYVFISVNAKGTVFNDKGNGVYTNSITNKGFKIISQNTQRLNDIAEEVTWFSIGRCSK